MARIHELSDGMEKGGEKRCHLGAYLGVCKGGEGKKGCCYSFAGRVVGWKGNSSYFHGVKIGLIYIPLPSRGRIASQRRHLSINEPPPPPFPNSFGSRRPLVCFTCLRPPSPSGPKLMHAPILLNAHPPPPISEIALTHPAVRAHAFACMGGASLWYRPLFPHSLPPHV